MTSDSYDDLSFPSLEDDDDNNDFEDIANDIYLNKEDEIDFTTPSTDKWKDIHPDSLGTKFTIDSAKTKAWKLEKLEIGHIKESYYCF